MINYHEEMDPLCYDKLVSIKRTKCDHGLNIYTIVFIAEMEGNYFQFEEQLTWFTNTSSTDEQIKKYFDDELDGKELDVTNTECYDRYDNHYQLADAYIFPDC